MEANPPSRRQAPPLTPEEESRAHRRRVIVWCKVATLFALTGNLKWFFPTSHPTYPKPTEAPASSPSPTVPLVITGEGGGYAVTGIVPDRAVTLDEFASAHHLDPLTVRALIVTGKITPSPVPMRRWEDTYLIPRDATIATDAPAR